MKKYKISNIFGVNIKEVEIERETKTMVVLKNGDREKKESRWHSYHDTFEQAKEKALAGIEKEVAVLQKRIDNARKNIEKIEALHL